MLFKVTLFILIITVLLFIVTQLVIPVFTNTRLLPMFRKTRSSLVNELAEVNSKLEEKAIQDEIEKKRAKLETRK